MADITTREAVSPVVGYTSTSQSSGSRIVSVDFMRGLALVVMAIDHARDFLTNVPFQPENMTHTYPALFLARWMTHFCAPLFFFLAGTGAYLLRRRTISLSAASRFLWTRGLWLVLLEFTVIDYAWTFVFWQMGKRDLVHRLLHGVAGIAGAPAEQGDAGLRPRSHSVA